MCMDPRWCVWSLYVWSGDMVCLLVGEKHDLLLEKTIWSCKMSSCWRRLYGNGRCLLVGEEGMLSWYDVRWYDMIWYKMVWYGMIWYDVV